MSKCVICGELIVGYGHNAVPVRDGRCCNSCNDSRVIPARLRALGLHDRLHRVWSKHLTDK